MAVVDPGVVAVVEIPPWWREATAPNRPRLPDPATARRHRPDPPRDAVTGQIRLRTGSSLPSHEPPRSTPRTPC